MDITLENIRKVLSTISLTTSGRNIIELGMVQNLQLKNKKLRFQLIFDKPDDPYIIALKKACIKAIHEEFNHQVKIKGNITVRIKQTEKTFPVFPSVKNVIAIASGKGGVGKSMITANLAVALTKLGKQVGLMDADIFGPSIPKMFGAENVQPTILQAKEKTLIQPYEKYNIKMLSIGFFVKPEQAMIWRGPMASNAFKQMMEEGNWGELDYILIDLPPGTSDIHLTLAQDVSITGVIIVSTPQEVALADVIKSIDFFRSRQINVHILGLVENMAWFTPKELPDSKYFIFGKDGGKKLAKKLKIKLLGQIPIVQSICESSDNGQPAALQDNTMSQMIFINLAKQIITAVDKKNHKFYL